MNPNRRTSSTNFRSFEPDYPPTPTSPPSSLVRPTSAGHVANETKMDDDQAMDMNQTKIAFDQNDHHHHQQHSPSPIPIPSTSNFDFDSTENVVLPSLIVNDVEDPDPDDDGDDDDEEEDLKTTREKTQSEEEREEEAEQDEEGGSSIKMQEPDSDYEEEKIMIAKKKRVKKEQIVFEPQLIGHLPIAENEAGRTYTEIQDCTYANKTLGNLAYFDEDSSRCECTYTPGFPNSSQACGDESHCVNRLMQIECVSDDCRCGNRCQNQRFQKKEYAPIEIVKTVKKGFGVRAVQDMAADTFIYEYVGEVIGPTVFAKRMKDYANEGVKHFYFMALDKDIFIDATKKGGKGRFLNHSCNPNCFVAKWTIGKKMRMGIFSKRSIKANEELTFNYNVDRYGHVAQECFCGEPNCVGFIGGKTQTDIGGMDDLYLDALGITEEVEALGLRGTKKKKGKKLDEDFLPLLRPIQVDEVPKVSAAVRQSIQTRRILEKLLTRIQMTNDPDVLSGLLRLHGFNLMNNILKEYPDDLRVITLDLEILTKWELVTRNKVESSKIEDSVRKCTELEDTNVKTMAQNLLDYWESLEMGYRIPRAIRTDSTSGNNGDSTNSSSTPSQTNGQSLNGTPSESIGTPSNERKRFHGSAFSIEQIAKRARADEEPSTSGDGTPSRPVWKKPEAVVRSTSPPLPRGWKRHKDKEGKSYYENTKTRATQWDLPTIHLEPASTSSTSSSNHHSHLHRSSSKLNRDGKTAGGDSTNGDSTPTTTRTSKAIDVNEIIAQVQKEAEETAAREEKERLKKEQEAKEVEDEERRRRKQSQSGLKRSSSSSSNLFTSNNGVSGKDKKVMTLFSSVVVQVMSKYKEHLEPDQFKKRAKEVTTLLCEKEKKHPSYNSASYDTLSTEKASKIKAFTKDWLKKLIERKRLSSSKASSSTPGGSRDQRGEFATPALALNTPSPGTPMPFGSGNAGTGSPLTLDPKDSSPPWATKGGDYFARSSLSGLGSSSSSVNGNGRDSRVDSPATPAKV